jgi:multiple sugar transport system permease protein
MTADSRQSADFYHSAGIRPTGLVARFWAGRTKYLVGALCLLLCAIMIAPLLASVLASVKSTAEAAAVPPTYIPRSISLDSYAKLWVYQAGLPTYLMNSFGTAFLAIALTLGLTVPAGFALARFPIPGKELLFVFLLLALIIPYQALLTPIFLMFAQLKLTNSLVGLAIIHTAIQLPFSLYVMRNAFEAVPRELEEAAVIDGSNSWQLLTNIFLPAVVPAMITVALFAFITSWNEFLGALVMMNRQDSFTLPLILAAARTETSLGGTDWGMLQAGVTVSIIPCVGIYLLLQRYYVSGFLAGAVK